MEDCCCDHKGIIRGYLEYCGVFLLLRSEEDFFPASAEGMEFLTKEQDEELRVILERGPQ